MVILRSDVLTAALSEFGARLTGLWHKDYGHSLVLGAPSGADCTSYFNDDLMYFGAIIGPVANRISGARVQIGDAVWQMDANEGAHCLHSGTSGLHAVKWGLTDQSERHATFRLTLEHGHGGLPGYRMFEVTYRLEGATLRLNITATSDRLTPVNIAHHPYWNLSQEASVAAHVLTTAADSYLPVDANLCPTGEIAPVARTPYDFTQARAVPTDITLDANLCLAHKRFTAPRFAARLTAPKAPELVISSTEPGLQVYNGAGLQPTDIVLHPGQKLGPCAGIALEPQGWPDAPAHPDFPSILLAAGTQYHQITHYAFS